jgi:hypothetical protein
MLPVTPQITVTPQTADDKSVFIIEIEPLPSAGYVWHYDVASDNGFSNIILASEFDNQAQKMVSIGPLPVGIYFVRATQKAAGKGK